METIKRTKIITLSHLLTDLQLKLNGLRMVNIYNMPPDKLRELNAEVNLTQAELSEHQSELNLLMDAHWGPTQKPLTKQSKVILDLCGG